MFVNKKRSNEAGITLVEVTVGLAIIALLAIFLAPRVGALFGKTRVELAQQEITPLIIAAQQYRETKRGVYTGITIAELASNGYHIDPFGDGALKNTYGIDIGLAASGTGDNTATLVYTTDESGNCNQLQIRVDSLKPVTATCAGAVLSAVIQ